MPLAFSPLIAYNLGMKKEKFRLGGGTALITGASSGIGKELANILIKEYGMTVIAVARSKEKLASVKDALHAENPLFGTRFLPLCADISLRQNWAEVKRFVEGRGEKLTLFVSNAGVLPPFSSEKERGITAPEVMEKTVQTNLFASVYGVETLRPFMKKSGGVAIISSSSALCTMPGIAAYASSKTALKAYAETLVAERSFAYVGLMLPGFTKTDVMRNQNAANGGLIDKISTSADKMARKIVKAIAKRKRRKILGADAKAMYLLSRIFPRSAPQIIGWVLKKSGYALFDAVFK